MPVCRQAGSIFVNTIRNKVKQILVEDQQRKLLEISQSMMDYFSTT